MREMPEIPDSVQNMSQCFSGDISLSVPSEIPAGVTDVSSCFNGCLRLSGTLTVHGNPEDYSNFLSDCSQATQLDLQGESLILDVLANTSGGNMNITVNGAAPNPAASYRDIIETE